MHTPKQADMLPTEWMLLLHMIERYDYERKCAWFRKSYAAEKMGCKERHIQTLIASLEEKGYIRVYERPKRHNRYVVPRLPGEVLPADVVIHEGDTLADLETGLVWKLRKTRAAGDDVEADALWEAPPTPVDETADAELETAFDAAVQASDDAWERSTRKRNWYEFLVNLQGAPPFGTAAAEWDTLIADLIARDVSQEDFAACYALASRKWNEKASIHPISVYNNLATFLPQVKAERTRQRKRETAAARTIEAEKRPELTAAEREAAARNLAALQEGKKQRDAAKMWRIKQGIWTQGHPANHANCATCAAHKRQWERQQSPDSAQRTG